MKLFQKEQDQMIPIASHDSFAKINNHLQKTTGP